jgi:hypothetical protein
VIGLVLTAVVLCFIENPMEEGVGSLFLGPVWNKVKGLFGTKEKYRNLEG